MAVLTLKSDEYKAFPEFLKDYASYHIAIKGISDKTVCEYLQDLRTFFRYLIIKRDHLDLTPDEVEKLSISSATEDDVKRVTESTIITFLMYTNIERKNTPTTRMRKLSALKSFFKYMCHKVHLIEVDPTANVDSPKKGSTLPKYLTLDEAIKLLEVVRNDRDSKTVARDYCIIALFLNTGMRLSELVGLDLDSFDPLLSQVRVKGKGNKERIIYINDSARDAIADYLKIRLDPKHVRTSDKAFFISGRETRISNKTVQWMVYRYLELAGLGSRGLSVHKLRHTAATLMYQSGKVDIRVLKEILGHEQLNTTQIYTHIVNRNLEDAVDSNPLNDVRIKRNAIDIDD